MYIDKLLDYAKLKPNLVAGEGEGDGSGAGEYILLVDGDHSTWHDIPLVVSREDFNRCYASLHNEPDFELFSYRITGSTSAEYRKYLLDMSTIKSAYIKLRQDIQNEQTVSSLPESTADKEYELGAIVSTVLSEGSILPTTVTWASDCSELFVDLLRDFKRITSTIPFHVVLSRSGYTLDSFLQEWRKLKYSADMDFIPLNFNLISFIQQVYLDCLRFLCHNEKDKALQLASLLTNLIYKE